MRDVIVGVLLLAVGGLLAFHGYAALRLVIALWGALVGFFVGAGAVAAFGDPGFLADATGWLVGGLVALIFGLIAYLYYVVSVVIGMGAIGYALGTSVMAALGVDWSWLVVLVGVLGGVLLAVLAVAGDLPMLILAVLGALAGASVMVSGILLLVGTLASGDLAEGGTTAAVELDWWVYLLYVALVVAGLVVQLRDVEARRGTLRSGWAG